MQKSKPCWKLVLAFLLLLLLYPLLTIKFDSAEDITENQTRAGNQPHIITREIELQVPVERDSCTERDYYYAIEGGSVQKFQVTLIPELLLQNQEEQWGKFQLNFSFMDENLYPYEIYGGDKLVENIMNDIISINDADFHSKNYEFYLGPAEIMSFDEEILNPFPGKDYWAIANVNPPKIIQCFKYTETVNITINKTFTEYRPTDTAFPATQQKTLGQIVYIDNFFEWFILISLLMIIIVLVKRIKNHTISV